MKAFFQSEKGEVKCSLRRQTMKMLLVILLFFSMIFFLSFAIILRMENDNFKIRTTETAVENVVSAINSRIENYNYTSRLIMVNERVLDFLRAERADRNLAYEAQMGMYEILNMYGNINYIESVYIFRMDGEFSNTGKGEYDIVRDHPEWERIYEREGARTIAISGNGMFQKNDGTPTLTYARAIYDINTQKRIGVLVMSILSSCFDEVLALQNTNSICILDENGTYLSGDEEIAMLHKKEYHCGKIVYNMLRYKGKRSVAAGKLAAGALVVIGYTYKVSNRVPFEMIAAMLLTVAALWGAAIYFALFIRKNISVPITSLGEAMERTRLSGWQPIDEEMPNSDLERLADSYNSMIDYLNQLFERLNQEKENIRKAEMRVLHEQIKPHFLYNTLGMISYISVQENASNTHDALETMGRFYRNFLSGGDRDISFGRELSITKDYLSLQKLRYGDAFEDAYEIEEKTLNIMVPKLILQPLVENCIYHGVRLKGELCTIRITAYKKEDGLHILVYDSGVGMSREQLAKVTALEHGGVSNDLLGQGRGFGLAGTIARIRYYCNTEDVVRIRSEEGEYTEIELVIANNYSKERENL